MKLDVRFPMGLLFAILGVLLLAHGAVTPPAGASHQLLGVNVNIACGGMFLLFGLLMLFLVKRSRRKK